MRSARGKRSKRAFWAALGLLLLSFTAACRPPQQRYEAQFLVLFNTMSRIVGNAPDKETFHRQAQFIYDRLRLRHELYDIYQIYPGKLNLCAINQRAGQGPIAVDPMILDLLEFSKEEYRRTGGQVNVAMGAVLSIWHQYRQEGLEDPENARLPPSADLQEAARHTRIEDLRIDRAQGTVELIDPKMRLDVGALAKGYAIEKVAQEAAAHGFTSGVLDIGGNLKALGRQNNGQAWSAGIQNPAAGDSGSLLPSFELDNQSLASSGGAQRRYSVAGKSYHHIIDPTTLQPAVYFEQVSVLCKDAGQADATSTALFTMDLSKGQALLETMPEAAAVWVLPGGQVVVSKNFHTLAPPAPEPSPIDK